MQIFNYFINALSYFIFIWQIFLLDCPQMSSYVMYVLTQNGFLQLFNLSYEVELRIWDSYLFTAKVSLFFHEKKTLFLFSWPWFNAPWLFWQDVLKTHFYKSYNVVNFIHKSFWLLRAGWPFVRVIFDWWMK